MSNRASNTIYIIVALAYFNAAFATIDRVIPARSYGGDCHGEISAPHGADDDSCQSNMRRRHARMIRYYAPDPVLTIVMLLRDDLIGTPFQHTTIHTFPLYDNEWIEIASSDSSPPFVG